MRKYSKIKTNITTHEQEKEGRRMKKSRMSKEEPMKGENLTSTRARTAERAKRRRSD